MVALMARGPRNNLFDTKFSSFFQNVTSPMLQLGILISPIDLIVPGLWPFKPTLGMLLAADRTYPSTLIPRRRPQSANKTAENIEKPTYA